jgi:protein MAK16
MFSIENESIWKIIGNKGFCSFKFYSKSQKFCKNKFNISGLCSKQSCPLVNTKYATILEKNGEIYLYVKDTLNSQYPDRLWKKFILSRNFLKSLQELDFFLSLWPKFFVYKTKQKLAKLHQILIRKKLDTIKKNNLISAKKEELFFDKTQEAKFMSKIKFENLIENELLHRLNLGIYGNLYPINPIRLWKEKSIQTSHIHTSQKKKISLEKTIKLNHLI